MLFNSYIFIFIFLPITFFIYFTLSYTKYPQLNKIFLILSSLFFYAYWNIIYLPLIILSILFNYLLSHILKRPSKQNKYTKKTILLFGVVSNLSLLGYFKYSDFFIENFNLIFDKNVNLLSLTLPLAISFFTFQQISYLVESYRDEMQKFNFLDYTLFVSFFPQLIAGPIVYPKEMMPQFEKRENKLVNFNNIALGIFIFSIGLFKKIIIADSFAVWATAGFDTASTLNLLSAWVTSLSYTFQLYFDFSGYTDMAIGIALLFNIYLPINFNSPYKALNIQDFWRRWHMTLSRFLRHYIYIPLGGNRQSFLRTYINLFATFLLAGLWHGAEWSFIFWGFLHGIALVIHKIWSRFSFKLWSSFSWFITFNFLNISWIFFRAKEWDDALKVLTAMFNMDNIVLSQKVENQLYFLSTYGVEFGTWAEGIKGSDITLIYLSLALIVVLFFKNSTENIQNFKLNYRHAFIASCAFFVSVSYLHSISEFLYFNF